MGASPDIYWYLGSGTDLAPLILDVPNNPTGERAVIEAADERAFALRDLKSTKLLSLGFYSIFLLASKVFFCVVFLNGYKDSLVIYADESPCG
jgi:hypothetical protein